MQRLKPPIANPSVIMKEVPFDNWGVLFNPDNASALSLNPTGMLVWKLIDGRRTVEDIAAAVRAHFREVPETVSDDVAGLLEILVEDGYAGYEVEA